MLWCQASAYIELHLLGTTTTVPLVTGGLDRPPWLARIGWALGQQIRGPDVQILDKRDVEGVDSKASELGNAS